MRPIESAVDTGSTQFKANTDAYHKLLATLDDRLRWAISGGRNRERSIERHLKRGKVLVRDRIDMVTDTATPFLEFSTLSGWGQYDNDVPGAGIVTGIGLVHGVPYVFIANDATVKGGSLVPMAIKKHVRAQDIAAENDLGVIYLVDSGGAFLPLQDEIFPDKDHFGGSFYRQARLSAQGLPQLSVVLGGCTAGGAYVPALSDEVIMVEGIGGIFLGGPPIVKAALGEIVTPDELGGAEVHTRISGVSDYMAATEAEAYGRLREICGDHQPAFDRGSSGLDRLGRARTPGLRSGRTLRHRLGRRSYTLRRHRDHRPHRRRLTVLAVQTRVGHVDRVRIRPDLGPSGRGDRQQRDHLLRIGTQGHPLHRVVRAAPHPARVSAEHVGLHGRFRFGSGAASPRTGPRWSRRWPTPRCRSTRC